MFRHAQRRNPLTLSGRRKLTTTETAPPLPASKHAAPRHGTRPRFFAGTRDQMATPPQTIAGGVHALLSPALGRTALPSRATKHRAGANRRNEPRAGLLRLFAPEKGPRSRRHKPG